MTKELAKYSSSVEVSNSSFFTCILKFSWNSSTSAWSIYASLLSRNLWLWSYWALAYKYYKVTKITLTKEYLPKAWRWEADAVPTGEELDAYSCHHHRLVDFDCHNSSTFIPPPKKDILEIEIWNWMPKVVLLLSSKWVMNMGRYRNRGTILLFPKSTWTQHHYCLLEMKWK